MALVLSVLRFWLFFRSFSQFLCQENFRFSVFVRFTAVCRFSVFKHLVSVFVKDTNAFSDLVSDAVFGFCHLGFGYSLI